jgi:hypothetical protein
MKGKKKEKKEDEDWKYDNKDSLLNYNGPFQ